MPECIFCQIVQKQIPARIVYEDDQVMAFEDLNPQAPKHVLLIPKQHISTLNAISEKDNALLAHMLQTVKHVASLLKIDKRGYRTIINCNRDAGQEVFHLHIHILGGRMLHWPPG